MLRIIAGEFRSRQLLTPDDNSISRPFASRVKESVFNLLRGWYHNATVIDLFAGVGTVGLECVSRGASTVFMVERNKIVYELLKRNIDSLGCSDRTTAVLGDALSAASLARAPRPADLIFVDPPYDLMHEELSRQRVLDQIHRCRDLMAEKGFVVLRSPLGTAEAEFSIEGFDGPEEHAYSKDMRVLLYAPASHVQTGAAGNDEDT